MNRQQRIAVARSRIPGAPATPAKPVPRSAAEQLRELFDSAEPDYNCSEGRHEPKAVRAATSEDPLGYFCVTCRVSCDAQGVAT